MSDSEKPKSSWRERSQSIKHKWAVPFVYFEWKCEQLSELLKQWAFLDILGHAGRLAILVALISYIMGAESRQKAKHYLAWQVINSAQGKPGGGGRMDALQDLYRDGISLASVDISKAYLPKLNLEYTDLGYANLAGADLMNANLARAYLVDANLAGANLRDVNLARAYLWGANLTGANLWYANLTGADLMNANLAGANLTDVNFARANLKEAVLKDIEMWTEIKSIEFANIYGIKGPTEGFLEWAIENGAVSIQNYVEWEKFRREKMQEQTKEK